MKKPIKIEVNPDLVRTRLTQALANGGEPQAELVAKKIVEHLEMTEMGMTQLIFAFMGIEEKCNWIVGDECMVHLDVLTSWDFDREKTIKEGLVHGNHIKGMITNIDMRKKKPIEFTYNAYYAATSPDVREIKTWINIQAVTREPDMLLARPGVADIV